MLASRAIQDDVTESSCDSDSKPEGSSGAALNDEEDVEAVEARFKFLDSIFENIEEKSNRRLLSHYIDKENASKHKAKQEEKDTARHTEPPLPVELKVKKNNVAPIVELPSASVDA